MRWDLILVAPRRGINPNEEEVQDIINENDVDGSGKVGRVNWILHFWLIFLVIDKVGFNGFQFELKLMESDCLNNHLIPPTTHHSHPH